MSEQSSQEPTMEEILASIRRIISEDDAPVDAAAAPPPEPVAVPEPVAAAPEPAAPAQDDEDDDALELTEKVDAIGDLEVYAPTTTSIPEPETEAGPVVAAPEPQVAPAAASLVGEQAASAAASAFGQLSAAIAMPSETRNLEDIVREMLRPMLQQWLDANLPAIVRQSVEAEVERIARARTR